MNADLLLDAAFFVVFVASAVGLFVFLKTKKSPFDLPKGQRSVYQDLHNLILRLSGDQWATLLQSSKKWLPNKQRPFQHILREDARLRNLFLECVAVQCVLLFRSACRSQYSDHADYITNGTIQELAIHFSKAIHQDFESVRSQITSRVEALARCEELRSEELLGAFNNTTTLGMHATTIAELLDIAPRRGGEAQMMILRTEGEIRAILKSELYEEQLKRSAPAIILSQL
jgi:hypothetical protein